VPDSSILIRNPAIEKWDTGEVAVVAVSNLVLGELERRKTSAAKDPTAAESASTVMKSLADSATATGSELAHGLKLNDRTWFISVALDRSKLALGLDAKQNDQQIAGAAGLIGGESNIPTILLTADINQKVFASSVGIPSHLERLPFEGDGLQALLDLGARVRSNREATSSAEPLDNNLPPKEAIVAHFVGRQQQLASLEQWLIDPDSRKWALTGDGGKGKTAIAYRFAESVVLAAASNIVTNVIWMSAKRRRYVEGRAVPVAQPDFATLENALDFLLQYFNDANLSGLVAEKRARVRDWLTTFPSLLIADDLDSIQVADEDAAEFFLDDILRTRSKVLLTSRRHYPGMGLRETEVTGLQGPEATDYIQAKAAEFGVNVDRFSNSIDKIREVTDGSPLYIEDLLRLCRVTGVGEAIHQWARRRGDPARAYALEREI
jgi:hypothetical protein